MEYKRITENDLAGKGVVGQADTPALSALEMQNKVEEIVRDVVIPSYNNLVEALTENGKPVQSSDVMLVRIGASGDLQVSVDGVQWQNVADNALEKKADSDDVYTKEETDAAIARTVTEIGAGDMQKAVYDTDGDGVVDNAEKLGGKTPGQLTFGADQIITDETTNKKLSQTLEEKINKSGGSFTGEVRADSGASTNTRIRNIMVHNNAGTNIYTDYIYMKRK